jgi:hypothetical protein
MHDLLLLSRLSQVPPSVLHVAAARARHSNGLLKFSNPSAFLAIPSNPADQQLIHHQRA